ncbi:MAG: hypothetical protein IPH85_10775 [Ignavibacteria bacterium]|nr:hypothetical protein [Ignavibacteria bacterium]
MAYTPPAPNAANFTAYPEYLEPGRVRHAFKFPVDVYVSPNAATLVFSETWYSRPNGLVANFVVSVQALTAAVATGAFTFEFFVEGHATYTNSAVSGNGAFTFDFGFECHAKHGVKGAGAFTVGFGFECHAKHGVKGAGAFMFDFAPAGHATVLRYELTGEVRNGGILVNRLVRVYRRDTGEMVGEANTVSGHFKVNAGFVEREHYAIPIDLANDATDWLPPCANRLVSVLASDT